MGYYKIKLNQLINSLKKKYLSPTSCRVTYNNHVYKNISILNSVFENIYNNFLVYVNTRVGNNEHVINLLSTIEFDIEG